MGRFLHARFSHLLPCVIVRSSLEERDRLRLDRVAHRIRLRAHLELWLRHHSLLAAITTLLRPALRWLVLGTGRSAHARRGVLRALFGATASPGKGLKAQTHTQSKRRNPASKGTHANNKNRKEARMAPGEGDGGGGGAWHWDVRWIV